MPTYEEPDQREFEWRPKMAPKMVWTADDERKFQAEKRSRLGYSTDPDEHECPTIGQVAQAWARTVGLEQKNPGEQMIAWAFSK